MKKLNTISSTELAEILNTSHDNVIEMIRYMFVKLYDGNIPFEASWDTIDLDYGHLLMFTSNLKGDVKKLLLKICKELKLGTYTMMTVTKVENYSTDMVTIRFEDGRVQEFLKFDNEWYFWTEDGDFNRIESYHSFNTAQLEVVYQNAKRKT